MTSCGRRLKKPWTDKASGVGDFTQPPRLHVVNKPTHRDVLWNPGMGLHPAYLLSDILFQIIKRMELRRGTERCSHFFRQPALEFVFLYLQQAAIGVIDDDEFLGVEQVMRNDERAQCVLGGNPAGIADHVRVPGMQTQAALKQNSGIHAGQHGYLPLRLHGQISEIKVSDKFLVGFQ